MTVITCLDFKTLKFRFLYLDTYRHAYGLIIVNENLISSVGIQKAVQLTLKQTLGL